MAMAEMNIEKRSLTPLSDDLSGFEDLWGTLKPQMMEEFGASTYRDWLSPLTFKEINGGCFVMKAPNRLIRDWVHTHCARRIIPHLRQWNPNILAFDVIVDSGTTGEGSSPEKLSSWRGQRGVEVPSQEIGKESDLQSSRLDPRYTFENFVVGKSNELAHAAARRVADLQGVVYNPLFLYGGVGLGKTHLMHAIAWHIQKTTPLRKVVYLSAEKFMYLFVRSLRFRDTMAFKEQFRSVDMLMIDDFQFISGKESTQEEFFHTFNALVDQNRQVVISADKSPADLDGLQERMRSRLGWGLVVDVHPTTYELRLGILQSKCEHLKANISQDVLEFLAHRITSNVRELEGALNRLMAHATLVGRHITLEAIYEVLGDVLRSNDRRLSVEEIQKKVAEYFNLRLTDLSAAKRSRNLARPRQIAMYLSKKLTTLSLPEIGRKFGGRDHTTVIHGVQRIQSLQEQDRALAEDLNLLTKSLHS